MWFKWSVCLLTMWILRAVLTRISNGTALLLHSAGLLWSAPSLCPPILRGSQSGEDVTGWWISYLHCASQAWYFLNSCWILVEEKNQIHPYPFHSGSIQFIKKAAFGITDYFIPSQNVPHRGYSQQSTYTGLNNFRSNGNIQETYIIIFKSDSNIFLLCNMSLWKVKKC